MGDHYHAQAIPKGALFGASFLIVATLALAAGARSSHLAEHEVVAAPLETVEIRFEDRRDGTLAVYNATTGREVGQLAPGTNGFIRGVLRGMFRNRKLESLGHDASFRLAREANGRLTLIDPETARRVELDSFGPTNSASFEQILVASRQTR